MCGILFLYDRQIGQQEHIARARGALDALAHRGPDEGADLVIGDAWLGQRRLSIIDLAKSHQPMSDPTGRHVLNYNGELYNYRQLRTELQGRWQFRTEGDTEVILAGLLLHGAAFLDRLEGMWAFVFWDAEQRRLLAARDRFGEKPLYFAGTDAGEFACASELPALMRLLPNAPREEDLDSTSDYFRYGFALPGRTAYVGIHEVLPAHFLEWSPAGRVRQVRYWSMPSRRFDGSEVDAEGLLQGAVRVAVQRRMVSDVPVGAMLSGGIDSTIVTSVAASLTTERMHTFTAGFTDASFDESRYAQLVSEKLGCMHHQETFALEGPDAIESLLRGHLGQPFADPSLLPTALVSRLAARSVKVALSGDGGDEIFCGYERYRARVILRWYSRLPAPLRKLAARAIGAIPEPTAHHSGSLLKRAHLFLRQADAMLSGRAYVAPELFRPDEHARLLPDLAGLGHEPPTLPRSTTLDGIDAMMAADGLVYLPQDILQKTDRASMAHSLELRAPFLDRDLVELAMSFPTQWQSGLRGGKRLLRRAFSHLLPPCIARRGKQGFAVPVGAWFRGGLGDALLALLRSDAGPLHAAEVEGLLAAHRSGARDHGLRLWAVYVYLLWRRDRAGRPT
mgnify:CR=1 FL=1